MKLAFIGAVEGSAHALGALLAGGRHSVRIYTLAPELKHRHSDFCDLRPLAREHAAELVEVDNINSPDAVADLKQFAPDYVLAIGWSQIIRPELLQVPRFGTIGFHPTLLPLGRGRAAIPWTILERKTESGATLFLIDEGMDSGAILIQKRFAIQHDETARTLYDKVIQSLRSMMVELAERLHTGAVQGIEQDHSCATYYAKRTWKEGLIDWQNSADEIWTLVRASGSPYPGAFTFYGQTKLTVWDACPSDEARYIGTPGQVLVNNSGGTLVKCGEGTLLLKRVELEGGPPAFAPTCLTRVHEILGIDQVRLWSTLNAAGAGAKTL